MSVEAVVEEPTRENLPREQGQHGGHLLDAGGEPEVLGADEFLVDPHFRRAEKRGLHGEREESTQRERHAPQEYGATDPREHERLQGGGAEHDVSFGKAIAHPAGDGREKDERQRHHQSGGGGDVHLQSGSEGNHEMESHRRSQRDECELRHLVIECVLCLQSDHAPEPDPLPSVRFFFQKCVAHWLRSVVAGITAGKTEKMGFWKWTLPFPRSAWRPAALQKSSLKMKNAALPPGKTAF